MLNKVLFSFMTLILVITNAQNRSNAIDYVAYPMIGECNVPTPCSVNIGIFSLVGDSHNVLEVGPIYERTIQGSVFGLLSYTSGANGNIHIVDINSHLIQELPKTSPAHITGDWSEYSPELAVFEPVDDGFLLLRANVENQGQIQTEILTEPIVKPWIDWFGTKALLTTGENLLEIDHQSEDIRIVELPTNMILRFFISLSETFLTYSENHNTFYIVEYQSGAVLFTKQGYPYGWTFDDQLIFTNDFQGTKPLYVFDPKANSVVTKEISPTFAFMSINPRGDLILYADVISDSYSVPCVIHIADWQTTCYEFHRMHPNGRPQFVSNLE